MSLTLSWTQKMASRVGIEQQGGAPSLRLNFSRRKSAVDIEQGQFIGRLFNEGLWGHPERNGDGRSVKTGDQWSRSLSH